MLTLLLFIDILWTAESEAEQKQKSFVPSRVGDAHRFFASHSLSPTKCYYIMSAAEENAPASRVLGIIILRLFIALNIFTIMKASSLIFLADAQKQANISSLGSHSKIMFISMTPFSIRLF